MIFFPWPKIVPIGLNKKLRISHETHHPKNPFRARIKKYHWAEEDEDEENTDDQSPRQKIDTKWNGKIG